MMEKPQSYFEWQLQFNSKKKGIIIKKDKNQNSLGIEEYQFEKFLEEWKKKNFPKKSQSRIISY